MRQKVSFVKFLVGSFFGLVLTFSLSSIAWTKPPPHPPAPPRPKFLEGGAPPNFFKCLKWPKIEEFSVNLGIFSLFFALEMHNIPF